LISRSLIFVYGEVTEPRSNGVIIRQLKHSGLQRGVRKALCYPWFGVTE